MNQRAMRGARGVVLGLGLLALAGCGGVEAIVECVSTDGVRVVCDLQNPEDLALLPGGGELLVSEFGGMQGEQPGSIAVLHLGTGEVDRLFPGAAAPDADDR